MFRFRGWMAGWMARLWNKLEVANPDAPFWRPHIHFAAGTGRRVDQKLEAKLYVSTCKIYVGVYKSFVLVGEQSKMCLQEFRRAVSTIG